MQITPLPRRILTLQLILWYRDSIQSPGIHRW